MQESLLNLQGHARTGMAEETLGDLRSSPGPFLNSAKTQEFLYLKGSRHGFGAFSRSNDQSHRGQVSDQDGNELKKASVGKKLPVTGMCEQSLDQPSAKFCIPP